MQPNNQGSEAQIPTTIAPAINAWSAEYLENMRRTWIEDPSSIPEQWQYFFKGFELGHTTDGVGAEYGAASVHQGNVDSLIYHYRSAGHYAADLDPLGIAQRTRDHLELASFDLDQSHLDERFDPGHLAMPNPSSLRDIIQRLDATYCRHVGVEYLHIEDGAQRKWLQGKMEPIENKPSFEPHVRLRILRKLVQATTLENFCATRYIGKKRFSLEGSESLIPMMRELINHAGDRDVEVVTIGMAHRGRINVLVNILNKSYDQLFTEFEESWSEDYVSGGGDVKYHLGYSADLETDNEKEVHITLASNPSHLEFGHSVVLGKARARQRVQHDENRAKCIPLIVHGDASFPGQGIVAEMFNMAHLDGYTVGGSIHFVVNNQIGFTTNPRDCYSGRYCTDIAKMVGAPIFHVNGDDPEACIHAVQIAVEYRQTFHNDVVIDMWSYRKHGHNETDEPSYTQPQMYETIRKMQPVTDLYANALIDDGILTTDQWKEMSEEVRDQLHESQQRSIENPVSPHVEPYRLTTVWEGLKGDPSRRNVDTTVSTDTLRCIAHALGHVPDGFSIHPKLEKLLSSRGGAIESGAPLDWGMGELLAFGSILLEGIPVRLTGQDVERGTFSHRHAVLADKNTGMAWMPLNFMNDEQAFICVHNSPLTESACLGYEYGYSLGHPNMLIVWEAQFGDFANGAQVIIDQFIASAEVKWQRASGLVMLLPHGYEGQGPEHSSARLERFLTLCANYNMTVINPTTPAQIFHALRRQIKWNFRKPLVVMSPKSLLRHPEAVSNVSDLTNDSFKIVIDDKDVDPSSVRRVIFCSGKVYYDLLEHRRHVKDGLAIALVRIEELYPLPEKALNEVMQRYAGSEFMFVQEEPENMGSWRYIDTAFRDDLDVSLTRVCRKACASPAVASSKMHGIEQRRILIEALGLPVDEQRVDKA
jgi:2-oxoglutarate dehydrogenase E1 component